MALQLADFNLSDERREFRDTLRRFFEQHAPIAEARRVMESGEGLSESLWKRASEELGLAGIAIAEEFGGQGFGLTELAIALGETGRALAPVPLFASAALAARVVQRSEEHTSELQSRSDLVFRPLLEHKNTIPGYSDHPAFLVSIYPHYN